MLNKRDYVIFDKMGGIQKIFCKVCGSGIAGTTERPRGSGPMADQMVERFMRFPNYVEAKFEFDDGSFHVTSGCRDCVHAGIDRQTMLELYQADMAEMKMPAGDRTPIQVIAVKPGGGIE